MTNNFMQQGARLLVFVTLFAGGLSAAYLDDTVPHPPMFDELIARIRNGETITQNEKEVCNDIGDDYVNDLRIANDELKIHDFLTADRVMYYMSCVKMSIIYPEKFDRLAASSAECMTTFKGFQQLRQSDKDTMTTLSCIIPAVKSNEIDYAVTAYKELLENDPFLASYAYRWLQRDSNVVSNAKTFLEQIKSLPLPKPPEKSKP